MYGNKGSAMTEMLTGITSIAIPLVVVGNVVAGFIYHMTSPETKARREKRKAEAAHKEKMIEITAMERDLLYAESYLLAKQDMLDKAALLAEIKRSQDAVEKSTRDRLRDQTGIRAAASVGGSNKVDELKARLAEMTKKLIPAPASTQTPLVGDDLPQPQTASAPQAKIIPTLQIPPAIVESELIRFAAKIACSLSGQAIHIGDELTAKKNADRYDIGKPNAPFAFANVSAEDFNALRDGLSNLPEPAVVKGNGHGKTDPL